MKKTSVKPFKDWQAEVITTEDIFDMYAVLEHLRDKMEDLYKNLI